MPATPTVAIRLRLRELSQLFNSFDPSPFHDRDLDADAEEFIVNWAREAPPGDTIELVLHLETVPKPGRLAEVEDAIRNYFATRAAMKQREFRQLMRRGRMSLLVGLLFLGGCLALGELLATLRLAALPNLVKESLTIGGWVAMWRPLEIYLYDWWPLRGEYRMLERLACVHVRIVLPEPT